MNRSFTSGQMSHAGSPNFVTSCEAAIYNHPDDVLRDAALLMAEKKAILASWISDARAVENAPSLRQLDSGSVVEVDVILRALVSLDDQVFAHSDERKWLPLSRRRGSRILRWFRRDSPPPNSNDNDDDPPPAPAGFGIPFRPSFVKAHGARPERLPGLACATA